MVSDSPIDLSLVRPTLDDRRAAFDWMTAPGILESMMGPPLFPEVAVPDFEGFCQEWEPHLWTHEDPRLGRLFLIAIDGVPNGAIAHNDVIVTAAGDVATELDMWLGSAEFRGRGLGPVAIDRLCAMLPALGVELVFLQPSARNTSSIRAYEKAGFQPVPMAPEQAASSFRTCCDYADSVFMVRRLCTSE
jgi:RimJ/RimL family protein N-acetyltransferase